MNWWQKDSICQTFPLLSSTHTHTLQIYRNLGLVASVFTEEGVYCHRANKFCHLLSPDVFVFSLTDTNRGCKHKQWGIECTVFKQPILFSWLQVPPARGPQGPRGPSLDPGTKISPGLNCIVTACLGPNGSICLRRTLYVQICLIYFNVFG